MYSFRVTFFYLATGMDGVPVTRDFGVIHANSPAAARYNAARQMGGGKDVDWYAGGMIVERLV